MVPLQTAAVGDFQAVWTHANFSQIWGVAETVGLFRSGPGPGPHRTTTAPAPLGCCGVAAQAPGIAINDRDPWALCQVVRSIRCDQLQPLTTLTPLVSKQGALSRLTETLVVHSAMTVTPTCTVVLPKPKTLANCSVSCLNDDLHSVFLSSPLAAIRPRAGHGGYIDSANLVRRRFDR